MCSMKPIVVAVALAALMCGCAMNEGKNVSTELQITMALIAVDVFRLTDDGPTGDEWTSLLDHVQLLSNLPELSPDARNALQIAVTTARAELERNEPFEDVVQAAITAINAALELQLASAQPDESP